MRARLGIISRHTINAASSEDRNQRMLVSSVRTEAHEESNGHFPPSQHVGTNFFSFSLLSIIKISIQYPTLPRKPSLPKLSFRPSLLPKPFPSYTRQPSGLEGVQTHAQEANQKKNGGKDKYNSTGDENDVTKDALAGAQDTGARPGRRRIEGAESVRAPLAIVCFAPALGSAHRTTRSMRSAR